MMPGQIAWSKGQHCGIRFSGSINVSQWADRAGPVEQQRIDATVAEFRSVGLPTAGRLDPFNQQGQNDIKEISDNLLNVCEHLAALPNMSVALAEELIKIEAAANALAGMARSSS